jgi:heme A synthase
MSAKGLAERVVWTFVQGFFGAIPVTFTLDKDHGLAVAYAGLAGGLAAVISLGKNLTAATMTKGSMQ